MKLPENTWLPRNIRLRRKKNRYFVDNEILEIYGSKLKPQGIALYNAIARHAHNDTQRCYPSFERLIALSGIGKRSTLTKYIRKLEELKLIYVIRDRKNRKVNHYILLNPPTIIQDSYQKGTSPSSEDSVQKETTQYPKGVVDSVDMDTLNQLNKSNNELDYKKERAVIREMNEYLVKRGSLKPRGDGGLKPAFPTNSNL